MEQQIPFVSVVVPVYKTEQHIARCIESILTQTHKKLELILVDDGSPDKSGKICDEYALRDGRVTVIHTPNRGVSHARNAGLERAKGDYLFFVDSDDWIEPEHVACLLPIDGEDMVYGGRKFFVNGQFKEQRPMPDTIVCQKVWLSNYTAFADKGLTLFFINACYDVQLIRKNKLRFDTALDISEEGIFNLEYMKHCRAIRYSSACTYCYEDGDDTSTSLSHKYQPKRLQAEIQKCLKTEEITGKKEHSVRWKQWKGVMRHYRKWLTFNGGERKGEAKEMLNKTYAEPYFRECIPYIRKHGTLDERIETYFMSVWAHPLYEPFYSIIAALSRVKNAILKRK